MMEQLGDLRARLTAAASDSSFICAALIFTAVAIILNAFFSAPPAYKSKSLPVWAPLEVALISYLVSANGWGRRIYSALRRRGGSLFGLTSKHQVLYDLPNVERVFSQPHHTLGVTPLAWTMFWRIFGVDPLVELRDKIESVAKPLVNAVERNFVNEANATAAVERADIAGHTSRLVSFATDPADREMWEAAANVTVLSPDSSSSPGAVEADLHALTRDFGVCIALPQMFGADFLEREGPDLLADFWRFDNDLFPLLMVGVPTWVPFKVMREGLAARERQLKRMIGLYTRIDQYQLGKPVDFGADMSDISYVVQERSKIFRGAGIPVRNRGQIDNGLFWGQNANTQPLVFWLLAYIYSIPGLLEELRKEIATIVPLDTTASPPRITALDLCALSSECPLFKSTLFETYRLANDPTTIRYVARPITITDGDYKHQLQPGTWVSAPHGAVQKDATLYPEPEKFVPDRFLETDPATGKRVARYGKLKPWGVGVGICKGRTFAEKELLGIAACIISLWEIEPVGGVWKIPAMRPGTGTMCPLGDIRVVLRRRTVFK